MLVFVSMTLSITILPAAFLTAIEMLSLCTSMPIYLVLLVVRGCSFLDGLRQAPKPYSIRSALFILRVRRLHGERWIAARQRELLPTRYWHVVFTLPSRLAPVVLQNKKVLYDLLFRSSAQTLLEVSHTNTRRLSAGLDFIACPTASYMSS